MPTPSQPRSDAAVPKLPSSTRPTSLILRVVAAAALEGRIAGRVEVVDTGESFAVKSAEDLVALVQRLAQERDDDGSLGTPSSVPE